MTAESILPELKKIVKKVTQEMEEAIVEAGEQASFDVGVHGINPELINFSVNSNIGLRLLKTSISIPSKSRFSAASWLPNWG